MTENTDTQPFLFKMMQSSQIMSFVYEYIIKNISSKTSDVDFLKNKNNIKYITIGICLFFVSSLIGILSYFLFYVMFFLSSLKCILWLFEVYNPKTIIVTSSTQNNNNKKQSHYISNASPIDVLEYYVIPIFIFLVMYPLSYIPIPSLNVIIYGVSVVLSLCCLTDKSYRQKFCIFVRDTFTDKNSRDNNGNYIPGNEGEFHKFLQTLCYSIDCIIMSTYNLTHKPMITLNQLGTSDNITHSIGLITTCINSVINKQTNQHNQYNQYRKQSNRSNQKEIINKKKR